MIRRFFSQEWAKLKEMNFTDKRQYIWEYYKIHIFVIGFSLFMIGSLINVWFINPPQRDYLYVAWQAGMVHTDPLDAMGERLGAIVPDQDRYQVTVRSYVRTGEPQMDQALVTRLHALISVGELHATITTSQGIQEGADFGLFRSPSEVIAIIQESNPALYEILTERLLTVTYTLYFEEGATPNTGIMGINISGAPLLVDVGLGMVDNLYLAVISNSQQVEGIARALAVMFGFEIEAEEDI